MFVIFTWRENYGHGHEKDEKDVKGEKEDVLSIYQSTIASFQVIVEHPEMLCLGKKL